MELTFIYTGKKSISMESVEYFLNVEFVLRNVVGIDEDVDHIHEDVIHKSLKSGG